MCGAPLQRQTNPRLYPRSPHPHSRRSVGDCRVSCWWGVDEVAVKAADEQENADVHRSVAQAHLMASTATRKCGPSSASDSSADGTWG